MANIGIILYEEKGDVGNKKPEDLGKCKQVYPGDLVINSMNYGIGSYGLSKHRGVCSPVYIVLTPKLNKVEERYAFRILEIKKFQQYAQSFGNGILEHRASISWDILKNIGLPLPSIDEQRNILQFLDIETAKIDTLIAEQEKLIELLKEKRQAVISQAVTKGLKTNVKMKDSGVAWLGEIPEHWVVRAIKHIVSTPVTDGPHETPEFIDEGVPFVSAEAVSSGEVDFTKIRGYISEECHKRYSSKYLPKKGDIFMVKSGATTGITAIVETDQEFNIWSPLAVIRCNRESNPYYVLNFMRSLNFQEAVALNWNFGTQQNIGMGVIENLLCPVPSLDEQKAIADYLTSFTKQFNTLIAEANSAIELFKERRSALISAAVTGQIDVRNYQTKEFQ
jgi:type I restriction enzyme S subunit